MRVGIAHTAFIDSFRQFFPDLELISGPESVALYDLVIFSGGADISPALYGDKNRSSYDAPQRDAIEVPIFKAAFNQHKKILGVCRGLQLANALLGGTLYQDLSGEAKSYHRGQHGLTTTGMFGHPVMQVIPQTVNSMHHQGIRFLGNGLKALAKWENIIEVAVSNDDKILLTQFHPEFMQLTPFFDYIKEWAVRKTKSKITEPASLVSMNDIVEWVDANSLFTTEEEEGE